MPQFYLIIRNTGRAELGAKKKTTQQNLTTTNKTLLNKQKKSQPTKSLSIFFQTLPHIIPIPFEEIFWLLRESQKGFEFP